MRISNLFRASLGIFLVTICHFTHAEPMLNGIGVHQELGREVFIGALFSESLSNSPSTLLRNPQPMRMELKIVAAEGITARRFSRLWIEGLAVNSKADELMTQADNTVIFDAMFKGRLVKDDHVIIANTPGKGVSVSVNNVALGTIADEAFFSMLLATWIGNVPLSSEYRDSLLKVGDVDASLRSRFSNTKPTPARIAEVNGWNSTSVPLEEPKTVAATKSEKQVAEEADTLKLAAPTIDKPKLDIPAPTAQTEAKAQAASSSSASKAIAAAAAALPTEEAEEDEGPALTKQLLLARQFYVSDAIKKIRTKTKYPQRALERSQEGSVRVAVVVDRQGNVVNASLLENSQHTILNKEALDAIKRAAPFPALPAEMAGARFEFTVPMRWALPKA